MSVLHPEQRTRVIRWALAALMLILGLWSITRSPEADFVQNYAAAIALMHGADPNGKTELILQMCCPGVIVNEGILQTAHPPVTTLLALPLATLPWLYARITWLLISWALIVWSWECLQLSPVAGLATLGTWLFGLSLGAFEPLLFALLTATFLDLKRAPRRAGMLLGLATAVKVYPALLILGLIAARQYRTAIIALVVAGTVTLTTEFLLGPGVTLPWLVYTGQNALLQVDMMKNLSLLRLLRLAIPGLLPIIGTLIATTLLSLPALSHLKRGKVIELLLPVMLLSSPIYWTHYVGLLVLSRPGRLALVLIGIGGTITWAVWVRLLPGYNLAPLGYGLPLTATLITWYTQIYPNTRAVFER